MADRVFTQTFAVVGAIIEKDSEILLVREGRGAGPDAGKWNQPAGWLDVGENPINAVKREVKEETGLDFEPTALVGVYSLWRKDLKEKMGATPHAVKLIFPGNVSGNVRAESGEEISELKWFTPEEIDAMNLNTLRDLDIKQEVRDYFAGRSYPIEIIRHTVSE